MARNHRLWVLVKTALLAATVSLLVACGANLGKVTETLDPRTPTRAEILGKLSLLQNLIEDLRTEHGVLPYTANPEDHPSISTYQDVDALLEDRLQEIPTGSDLHGQADELITAEINKRDDFLLSRKTQLDSLPHHALTERLALVNDIFDINDNAELRDENREQALQTASNQAYQWLHQEQFEKASTLFKTLLDQGYDAPNVEQALSEATFNLHMLGLERQLERGDVDAAYESVTELLNDETNERFYDQLHPFVGDLAGFFSLSASGSLLAGDLMETYDNLRKMTRMAEFADLPTLDRTVEQDFIAQMFVLADEARSVDSPGLAMAYLKVIEDFDASYPEATYMLNNIRDTLYNASITKVATFPFAGTPNAPGLGALISATLVQHFIDAQYKDIRILERQSLQDVVQEQQIRSMIDDRDLHLTASDYLIQGTVVEANVETTIQESRITKRVLVDVKRVSNPAYTEWLELTSQQRKKRRAPPAFLPEEVQEDVTTTETLYSKLGSVTVNYRIIDSSNGELVHAATVNLEEAFEDASLEGVEIGRFVQKAKHAILPADMKILRVLATSLSQQIAVDVVRHLENPERRYVAAATQLKANGQSDLAVRELAKAVVMLEAKEQRFEEELTELKALALRLQ